MSRFKSTKDRINTKDRIIRSLHGEAEPRQRTSWFRKSNIMYPLLMIIVFAFLGMAMSAVTHLQKKQKAEEALIDNMDYDTARNILNSSGKESDEGSENSN